MIGISMTVSGSNHESVIKRIYEELVGKQVNFAVLSIKLGETQPRLTKFRNRSVKGEYFVKGMQARIAFLPGESISWDLNCERVSVKFENGGDIVITRVFEKTASSKTLRITTNPI